MGAILQTYCRENNRVIYSLFQIIFNHVDEVGVLHNQHLVNYYNQEFTPTPSPQGSEAFFRSIGFDGLGNMFPSTAILIDKTSTVEDFISNHSTMSNSMKSYLLQMCSSSGNTIELQNLEQTVLSDKNLASSDAKIILIGIAVARHSSEYWNHHVGSWVNGANPTIFARNYAKIDATTALTVAMSCNLGFVTPPSGMTVLTFAAASGATASTAAAIADGVSWVAGEIGKNTGWW